MTTDDINRLSVDQKLLTRLFSKIKISTEHFYKGDPCWDWQNNRNNKGYGMFSYKSKKRLAHIICYQLFVEIVPVGAECDHLCRRPICINPAHIEAVSHKINALRSTSLWAENAKKTHCKRGHEFTEENTYIVPNVAKQMRKCRACMTEASKRSGVLKYQRLRTLPVDHPDRIKARQKAARDRERLRNLPFHHPSRSRQRESQKRSRAKRKLLSEQIHS